MSTPTHQELQAIRSLKKEQRKLQREVGGLLNLSAVIAQRDNLQEELLEAKRKIADLEGDIRCLRAEMRDWKPRQSLANRTAKP